MRVVDYQPQTETMPFEVRPMTPADIVQSVHIERDAFPTVSPPTAFSRELKNRITGYLTACRSEVVDGIRRGPAEEARQRAPDPTLLGRVARGARRLWGPAVDGHQTDDFIAGYVGIWYMADEAHIMSIGVRTECRGLGVGELLLIGAIEQALARRARLMTLEVRESNYVAINLYQKYLFSQRGVRKGYYADNREDAIIMSTGPIGVHPFPDRFQELVGEHARRWGHSHRMSG